MTFRHTPHGKPVWHILTGEYPPAPGGVADHTRILAVVLQALGRTFMSGHLRERGTSRRSRGCGSLVAEGFGARGFGASHWR